MGYHEYPGAAISGTTPHGYTDAGNPVKIGGKASAADPVAVANGQRVDAYYDLNGRIVVNLGTRLSGLLDSVQLQMHNGTVPEDLYDNTEIVLLASAARAATNQSADQVNRNSKGLLLVVNVSDNAAAGSITPSLQLKDSISGSYFTYWTAAAALVAVATSAYLFFPGLSGGSFTEAWPFGIPARTWRLNCTHNNANVITYSVSGVILL